MPCRVNIYLDQHKQYVIFINHEDTTFLNLYATIDVVYITLGPYHEHLTLIRPNAYPTVLCGNLFISTNSG